jgi:phosphatidylserine/phosphatidylglycerophosphate/cardiolipin synthase-like enzyme
MNMTEDYCGADIGGTDRFQDIMARVRGPAVANLAGVFVSLSLSRPLSPFRDCSTLC